MQMAPLKLYLSEHSQEGARIGTFDDRGFSQAVPLGRIGSRHPSDSSRLSEWTHTSKGSDEAELPPLAGVGAIYFWRWNIIWLPVLVP